MHNACQSQPFNLLNDLKKMIRLFVCAILLLVIAGRINASITLTSTRGTEGRSSSTTSVRIDAEGSASTADDFIASGAITTPDVRGTTFRFTLDAISAATTELGPDFGAKHTDGSIDRDNTGKLGVRGGTNGINEREGLLVGLDAAGLDSRVGWQLTGVQFAYVGDGESYIIVNRNDPELRLTGDTDGMIDVSRLGLFVRGGTSDRELASVFAGDGAGTGGRRIQLSLISKRDPPKRLTLEQVLQERVPED